MPEKTKKRKLKLEFKFDKRLTIILGVLAVLALLFNFKHLFLAGMVNNRLITRFALDRELEKQAGQQVLETMITKSLIFQEAKQQKVKIKQDEIDKRVEEFEKQLEAQNNDLESFLQIQGQTRKDLEEQVRIQLILETVLGKDIEVTEGEAQEYFDENQEFFPEGTQFEDIKDDLQKEIRQNKIGEKFQPWLAELKEKAKTYYFLRL